MAMDFSKGVDFSPLEKLGISKEGSMKFLVALTPMIDMEFQTRVRKVFSDEEIKAIGAEAQAKGIKPKDGMILMEEKYHAKTGRYFMEEMRLLFNEHVVHAANIITKARRDTESFSKSGEENVKRFETLMEEKKWEEAAKFLDDTLNKTPTP
jgi:hypothetical protein